MKEILEKIEKMKKKINDKIDWAGCQTSNTSPEDILIDLRDDIEGCVEELQQSIKEMKGVKDGKNN